VGLAVNDTWGPLVSVFKKLRLFHQTGFSYDLQQFFHSSQLTDIFSNITIQPNILVKILAGVRVLIDAKV
jgi:hypothetical protein